MDAASVQQLFQAAQREHQAGRVPQAESLYRQILAAAPDHAGALHYLGVCALQSARYDAAVEFIARAIAVAPGDPYAHFHLANAFAEKHDFRSAIASFEKSLALDPRFADAANNLGNALKNSGRPADAIAAYQRALAVNPNHLDALANLGKTLMETGDPRGAIASYRRAAAAGLNTPENFYNLGVASAACGENAAAIQAYQQAIALDAAFAPALYNLSLQLKNRGEYDAALALCRRAIAASQNFAGAWAHLGNLLRDVGEIDEAIAAFRKAIALDPRFEIAQSNLLYALHFHPDFDAAAIAREHRQWNALFAEPLAKQAAPHTNNRDPNRRLRIGYISPYFRDHVVGRNLVPLFEHHDPARFEIFCYANDPRRDGFTARIQSRCAAWRDIAGLSDDAAADLIRADRIDILVDLTLHLAGNRLLLFARKPAPLQVTFAGYPAASGLAAVDYRLSDPHLDPPERGNADLAEKIIRLPDSFWCYDPFEARDIPVAPLPAQNAGRVTFACLNNYNKVNRAVLSLWAQVLTQVERSHMLILSPEGDHRRRARELFSAAGVSSDRIDFAAPCARRDYLELYHRVDIGLDTFPYNGHTTSLDSFYMGVPVVTLVGNTSVSRAGLSQLTTLGLAELAAETPARFIQKALALAGDLPRLAQLRAALRGRMQNSPLMNAAKFSAAVESAYRQIWQTWCALKR